VEDWRNIVKTRSVYIADDLQEPDGFSPVLVCLPLWGWYVARSFLRDYGTRRTSFATAYRSGSYLLPDDMEYNIISNIISQSVGADIMSVDDLVTALGGIETAILAGNECACGGGCGAGACSEGSGGSGPTDGVIETFEDDGEATFPPLFDTREEYTNKKCGIARGILDQMLSDLLWVENGNILSITISGFLLALFTPIPGDELLAFVAVVLSIFLQGILIATVSNIRSAINSNLEELVCVMVDADTSFNAQGDFLALLGLAGVELLIADYFVNNDNFNRLFNYGPFDASFDPCDCGVEGWDYMLVTAGTIDEEEEGQRIVISSETSGSVELVTVLINKADCGSDQSSGTPRVTLLLNGHVTRGVSSDFQFYTVGNGDCGQNAPSLNTNTVQDFNDDSGPRLSHLTFAGHLSSPFTITIEFDAL